MKQAAVGGGFPTMRLVLVPALISLVVTLWRLTGELLSWSTVFFNPEAGGVGAVIGITWLAPIFGIYFALHLAKNGDAPSGWGKAIGFAVLGCLLLVAGGPVQAFLVQKNFFGGLLFIWLLAAMTSGLQYFGWPQLFRTLLAYGLGARLPVVLIMALAMHGTWGTHYDAIPPGFPELGGWASFLWLGLLPQLLFWVGFTIVFGAFFGIPVASLVGRRKPTIEAAPFLEPSGQYSRPSECPFGSRRREYLIGRSVLPKPGSDNQLIWIPFGLARSKQGACHNRR